MMRRFLLLMVTVSCIGASPALAQTTYSKYTIYGGAGPSFNQGQMSNFADTGWHFVGGGGYNFTENAALVGEYMYYKVGIKDTAAQQAGLTNPSTHFDTVTANGIFRVPMGLYGIAGGGWMRRRLNLGEVSTLPPGSICPPIWTWWGAQCTSGSTTVTVQLGSRTDNAWEVNVGAGFAFKVHGNLKGYTEFRFHEGYTSGIRTQITPWTFGVRW